MEKGWLAGLAPEALLAALGRRLTAQTTAGQVFEMFEPEGAASQRIPWGGSGNWRALFSTPDGLTAAFEFDAGDRLVAYGVMPGPAGAGAPADASAASADIPLVFVGD